MKEPDESIRTHRSSRIHVCKPPCEMKITEESQSQKDQNLKKICSRVAQDLDDQVSLL